MRFFSGVLAVCVLIVLAPLQVGAQTGVTQIATSAVCDADISQDGVVDVSDYSLLVANFLQPVIVQQRSDITRDGIVDLSDYTILVNFFLKNCVLATAVPTSTPSSTPHASPQASPTSSPVLPTATPPVMSHTYEHAVPQPMGFVPSNPVLVSRPYYKGPVSTGTGANSMMVNNVDDLYYIPRGYKNAPYAGWDWIKLPSGVANGVYRTYTMNEWLFFELERPAKVAIVWDGSLIPNWLSSWQAGQSVNGRRVFVKSFAAGKVVLGAIGGSANYPYDVLIAESDGTPSTELEFPAGKAKPVASTTCPAWVHDEYAVQAPDGRYYRTWHEPIDQNYWCYFRHEHGSNPTLFADGTHTVPFGYVTNRSDHLDANEGFKIWVLRTVDRVTGRKYDALFEVHFGTSRPERSCQRHHATSLYIADSDTKELLTRITFVGDFGIPFKNGDIETEATRIKCPNLSPDIYNQTFGIKKVRVMPDNEGYENWRIGTEKTILGFANNGSLTFDTHAPMTGHSHLNCTWSIPGDPMTISCGTPLLTNQNRVGRFIGYLDTFHFSAARAARTGVFYTDEYGEVVRNATDNDAVQQYIKPGVEIRLKTTGLNETGQQTAIFTNDPWNQEFLVKNVLEFSSDWNYEKSIQFPN